MFGNNPIRPPVSGTGDSLDVQNIFATFQGEGPYTGWPSVFIRLGGCNLACKFCDTEFESFKSISLAEIINEVEELSVRNKAKLIVITGGEPFRQPIEKLCEQLVTKDYLVQIETNGTIYRELAASVKIICSPKNTRKKYQPIRDDLLQRLDALKFIVSADNPLYKDIAEVGQSRYNIPVYVQPMDEIDLDKNKANMKLALKIAEENGYRISLQTHKILGVE